MRSNELQNGDYFQSTDSSNAVILGRKIDDLLFWFDIKTAITESEIMAIGGIKSWSRPVEIIDFFTFLATLVGQCMEENKPVEEIDKQKTIKPNDLKHGQFFIDPMDNVIGRRFKNTVVYWTTSNYECMDTFPDISADEIIPVTLPQAVLFEMQKL